MATPINTIYSWFETGDFPTQAQFQASWSSFWHKDEAIPMTNISGLSDQFGKFVLVSTFNAHLNDQNAHPYFAKKDASNLTPTNVNDWKAKLGVGDLPENIATYDYDIHNQVMMKDGTTKEATDLGKNIANSSLNSIAGAGLKLGSSWTLDTNGQLYSITNLPDKSTDASFNKMLIQNSTGQVAWGNGKTNFLAMPSILTPAEKDKFGSDWGGQYSNSSLQVYSVAPPIFKSEHTIKRLVISGINLNTNPNYTQVTLIPDNNVLGSGEIAVQAIQPLSYGVFIVDIYGDSIVEDTYYNLVFRTTQSIIQTYRTTQKIRATNDLQILDLSSLTWSFKAYTPGQENSIFTSSGGSISYTSSTSNKPYNNESILVGAASSSQFVPAGVNFYIKGSFKVEYSMNNKSWTYIGLRSPSTIELLNDLLAQVKFWQNDGTAVWAAENNTSAQVTGVYSADFIFIRENGSIYIEISANNITKSFTKITSNEALSLGFFVMNAQALNSRTYSINEAYTF